MNGSAPATNVTTSDSVPGCTRTIGAMSPDATVNYVCTEPTRPYSNSTVTELAQVTGSVGVRGLTTEVTDSDESRVSSGGPATGGVLPITEEPVWSATEGLVRTIERHFVGVMLLVTLLGVVLLAYEHLVTKVEGSDDSKAGWRADPFGRHELRWWNGSVWTPHVHDAVQDPPG